ncbi:MAG: TonB-dependent receptor domain-containing protein [Steroidobacterales bacterium]
MLQQKRNAPGQITLRLLGLVLALFIHTTAVPAEPPPNAPVSVEIPAQPLTRALDVFASATGLQLIYVSELAEGRTSRPVPPGLGPSAALARLLAGTGLDFVFLNSRTVKIFATPPPTARASYLVQKPKPAAAPPPAGELEEVLVTSDKRAEPLGTVPISVAVLSQNDMEAMGVKGISDIAAFTPGLQFDFDSEFGPGLLTNIAIRGIIADKGAPTTGIYIDDVPIQASLNVFRNAYPVTFDLAQVEVLRGPQGTLFGSSALSGAVRFITNEASLSEFSARSHLEVSSTQQGGTSLEIGAAAGGPIVPDRFGARISAWYRSDGGYLDRIDPFTSAVVDPNTNRSTSKAVRLGLTIEPTDTLRIVPSVTYQSVDRHDTSSFYTPLSDPGDGLLRSGNLLRQPYEDTFTLSSVKVQQSLGAVDLTGVTAYFDRSAAATDDETSGACAQYFGGCGNPLGPAYPTSYSQAVPNLLAQHHNAFSQELRLSSAAPAARFSWVAGVFYWKTRQNGTANAYQITAPDVQGIYSATRYLYAEISAFGQVYWTPSPRWRLGIGTRRGWAREDAMDIESGFANNSPPFSASIGPFKPLPATPRFDLSYNVDENNMLYIAVAKGARPGAANAPAQCDGIADPTSYTSDAIWNYELGAKNLLFERRLQLAASVFLIRWDAVQEHLNDACGTGYTTNAGSARSTGFDLAAEALLTERLHLRLALGLTDGHHDSTVLTAGGQVVVDRGSAIGVLPTVASPWTGTVSVQYRRPLTSVLEGYVAADDIFSSHNPGPFTESDPRAVSYSPGIQSDPATNRLNVRAGVVRSNLEVRLWVENALNSLPVLHLESDAAGSSLYYAYTSRPRTVGLSADWKF